MNLLNLLLDSQNSPAIKQLAANFGLSEDAAKSAVSEMVPALSRGLQKNASTSQGLEALTGALSKGNHQRYVDQPESLTNNEAVTDGNAILGHIFGSKDVSRQVASHAASATGLDSGILKKMLPMVATMVMGSMSKQATSSGLPGGSDASGTGGLLMQLLDSDKDGSVMDDIIGLAGKFMR
jgi:hypothetical protein